MPPGDDAGAPGSDEAAAEKVLAVAHAVGVMLEAAEAAQAPVAEEETEAQDAEGDDVGDGESEVEAAVIEEASVARSAAARSSAKEAVSGPARSARPVIELTPQPDQNPAGNDQNPDGTALATAPERIAEPLVLVGHPSLGSTPRALPVVAEPAPDSIIDGGTAGGLVARAASIRGDDHRYLGETRQDSVGLWTLGRDPAVPGSGSVLLAAVADGVGSRPLSHLGSAAACRLARQHAAARLSALLKPEPAAALVDACRATVSDVAAGLRVAALDRGTAPEQFATTLIVALVVPAAGDDPARAVVFAVGDGSAAVLHDGAWRACAPAGSDTENEGVMSTGTDALPMHPDRVRVALVPLEPGDALLLCTDGLGNPMRNDSVRDQLAAWWGGGQAPSLPEFYWQLNFRAQTFGDDRSAVCVWVP